MPNKKENKSIEKIISECCICHQVRKEDGKYYTPSIEQRRKYYTDGYKISHGLCEDCYIIWDKKLHER